MVDSQGIAGVDGSRQCISGGEGASQCISSENITYQSVSAGSWLNIYRVGLLSANVSRVRAVSQCISGGLLSINVYLMILPPVNVSRVGISVNQCISVEIAVNQFISGENQSIYLGWN